MAANLNYKLSSNILDYFLKQVVIGIKDAIWQDSYFSNHERILPKKIIESLLVINIAQNLIEWSNKYSLIVNLEYPLKDFYNGAFVEFRYKEINTKRILTRRKNHNPIGNKSGRVDIAITKMPFNNGPYLYPNCISLIGVEVKAINSSFKKIESDIKRLADALTLKDEVSENSIQVCLSLFIKRIGSPNKLESDETKYNNEIEAIKDIQSKIQSIKEKYPDLIFELIINNDIERKVDWECLNLEDFNPKEIAENSGKLLIFLLRISKV